MPISLSYTDGNGIKPDGIPGWTGYGWSLQAGGYVHRTVRGEPDEKRDFKTFLYYYDNRITKETVLNATDFSYLGNFSKLNVNDWYSQSLRDFFSPTDVNFALQKIVQPDRDVYTFNHHPPYNLIPDEFTFSFGGASGKFYLNHANKWVVESSDGKDYSIAVETGAQTVVEYFPANPPGSHVFYQVPRIIKYLTITSTDGVKYYFGNTNLNATLDEQYYEYSRTSEIIAKNVVDPYTPLNEISGNTRATLVDLVPHTWYLSKVENLKTGSVITLNYARQNFQFYTTNQAWGYGGSQPVLVHTNDYENYKMYTIYDNYADPEHVFSYEELSAVAKVLTKGCFLTSINYPDGVTVNFNATASTQLGTDQDIWRSNHAGFYHYEDIFQARGIYDMKNTLPQLNTIQVYEGHKFSKKRDSYFNITDVQANLDAGGVRIARIG